MTAPLQRHIPAPSLLMQLRKLELRLVRIKTIFDWEHMHVKPSGALHKDIRDSHIKDYSSMMSSGSSSKSSYAGKSMCRCFSRAC